MEACGLQGFPVISCDRDIVQPTCNKQGEVDVDVMNHDLNKAWMLSCQLPLNDGNLCFQKRWLGREVPKLSQFGSVNSNIM